MEILCSIHVLKLNDCDMRTTLKRARLWTPAYDETALCLSTCTCQHSAYPINSRRAYVRGRSVIIIIIIRGLSVTYVAVPVSARQVELSVLCLLEPDARPRLNGRRSASTVLSQVYVSDDL